jgi:uncharacterized membrane protein YagU involved in acid resistance
METTWNDLAAGAVAGLAATAPMSLAMDALHQQLPHHERHALPPRKITERLTDAVGLKDKIDETGRYWLTLASHFGYGTAAGALYGPLARRAGLPTVASGMAYGLAVWGASYLGLLPVLGVLSPATRHSPRRNALMIAAHLVWGAALGTFVNVLDRAGDENGLSSFSARPHDAGGGE